MTFGGHERRKALDWLRRRDFVMLLSSAAAWPLAVRARPIVPVVGCLSGGTPAAFSRITESFRLGLNDAGYVEGRDVELEFRWGGDRYSRLPELAADLARLNVTAIATFDTASALAAKAATATIPIVFSMGADPIKIGLVDNLARPGGNVTGISYLSNALGPKRLGLLREIVPMTTTFGFLVDPTNPNTELETKEIKTAADLLGCELIVVGATNTDEVDKAFVELVERRIGGLDVSGQGVFLSRAEQLGGLTLRYRIPTIYVAKDGPLAGFLISYSGNIKEAYGTCQRF